MKEPRSFTVEKELYPIFRKACKDRTISVSAWLEKVMTKQLEKWNVKS